MFVDLNPLQPDNRRTAPAIVAVTEKRLLCRPVHIRLKSDVEAAAAAAVAPEGVEAASTAADGIDAALEDGDDGDMDTAAD